MKYDFFIINRHTKRNWPASAEEAYLYVSKKFGLRDEYIIIDYITRRAVEPEDVITAVAMHDMNTKKAGRIIPDVLLKKMQLAKAKADRKQQ